MTRSVVTSLLMLMTGTAALQDQESKPPKNLEVEFKAFTSSRGGEPVWSERQSIAITQENELVVRQLSALLKRTDLWLEIAIDGKTLESRQSLPINPWALKTLGKQKLEVMAAPGGPRIDVEIDAVGQFSFPSFAGLESTIDVVTFRHGGDSVESKAAGTVHHLPDGLVLSGQFLEANAGLRKWTQSWLQGNGERRKGKITIVSSSGDKLATFDAKNLWPNSHRLGIDEQSSILTESFTLQSDSIIANH